MAWACEGELDASASIRRRICVAEGPSALPALGFSSSFRDLHILCTFGLRVRAIPRSMREICPWFTPVRDSNLMSVNPAEMRAWRIFLPSAALSIGELNLSAIVHNIRTLSRSRQRGLLGVYVDNEQIRWRGKVWCHLVADTLDELHRFAAEIGLKRAWFQDRASYPHYDVTLPVRAKAIRLGASESDRRTTIACCRRLREELLASRSSSELGVPLLAT